GAPRFIINWTQTLFPTSLSGFNMNRLNGVTILLITLETCLRTHFSRRWPIAPDSRGEHFSPKAPLLLLTSSERGRRLPSRTSRASWTTQLRLKPHRERLGPSAVSARTRCRRSLRCSRTRIIHARRTRRRRSFESTKTFNRQAMEILNEVAELL